MYSEDLVINAGNKRDKNEKEQRRMDGRREEGEDKTHELLLKQ